MTKLKTLLYTFLNRYFPEQAYRFVPLAPKSLQLTPEQTKAFAHWGIEKIRLEYRRNVGTVVQRSYWEDGEMDSFVPVELNQFSSDVFMLTRVGRHTYEVRAGESYHNLSAEDYDTFLKHLYTTAVDTINYTHSRQHLEEALHAASH